MKDEKETAMVKATALSSRFDEAFLLAHDLHRNQRRKATNAPYICHLLAVSSLVIQAGGDEEMAIAALLHDAIEDQGHKITLEQISAKFIPRVARIVDDCTDAYQHPKPEWKARKEAYLARVPGLADDSRLVCTADKLDNATSVLRDHHQLGDVVFERFKGKKSGTLWWYRAIADSLANSGGSPLAQELELAVTALERDCSLGNGQNRPASKT